MTTSRSTLIITAIALILLTLVPAVSANEIIYDEALEEHIDTTKSGVQTPHVEGYTGYNVGAGFITFADITKAKNLYYIVIEIPGEAGYWGENRTKIEPGRYDFTYYFNGEYRPGIFYLNEKTNFLGFVTSTQFTIFLNDWDIGNLTDEQSIGMPFYFNHKLHRSMPLGDISPETNLYIGWSMDGPGRNPPVDQPIKITEVTSLPWKHHITVEEDELSYYITINGFIDDDYHIAQVNFSKGGEIFSTFRNTGEELKLALLKNEIDLIEIISPGGTVYAYPLESDIPGGPDAIPVDIYVRNSQTGNLLAGSHIIISASVGGEFHEVVNQTLPGGTATYTLQPTGGGLPNPDYYRLIATADGYNPYMPYIDFELDRPTNLIVMMEPITGGPVDENKTFIEFYVRDLSGNGISDASVTCGGYTLITNSAGYTQFEMPKNAIYPYTVRKSGYVTIEGTATVGDGPRYTVNVVLGPKEIPTYTPDPGETPGGPGATPTPDRRTNEEKGQAVIDMLADNAEGLGALALICLMFGLLKLMVKW